MARYAYQLRRRYPGVMKGVAVIGLKKSGKTTVAEALVRELARRGYRVAAVKHAHGGLTLPEADSTRLYRAGAAEVIAVSPGETEHIASRGKQLWEALSLLRGYDYVVVEGFKSAFPGMRIVAARTVEEALKFKGPLVLAYSGPVASLRPRPELPAPVVDALGEPGRLADLVEERAFEVPPALDCGFCKYKSCIGLATAIARGEATIRECTVLASPVRLRVDGEEIALNPFVQDIIANVVRGVVATLKGVPEKPSKIEIEVTG